MGSGLGIALLLVVGLVAANLPWFSDRVLLLFRPRSGVKSVTARLGEWLLMYAVFLLAGFGLERAVDGAWHSQSWVFYAVTLCLFAVFAAPGVIWRKDLLPLVTRP